MNDGSLDQRFAEAMGQLLGPEFPKDIALAVSGGGDSMAMFMLAHQWARVWGVRLWVVTVDHGLRRESSAEAQMVATEAAALGWPHATLRWRWTGQGNVQDQARRARLELIDRWRAGIEHVLMAHTADDVAENFLMRFARGSGVEGLSHMRAVRFVVPHPHAGHAPVPDEDISQSTPPPLPSRRVAGVSAFSKGYHVVRPCLGMTRAELRHYAKTLQVPWVEDPSNDDPKYDRARARAALPLLAEIGIDADNLRSTALRMQRASVALKARALDVAKEITRESHGALVLDRARFERVERDTQLRLLAAACMWISSAPYRPRAASLEALLDTLLGGGTGTLQGTMAQSKGAEIFLYRELAAIMMQSGAQLAPFVWDERWKITGTGREEIRVAPIADALKDIENWREIGLPRAALMSNPAIWSGEDLICAPTIRYSDTWNAQLVTGFITYLETH